MALRPAAPKMLNARPPLPLLDMPILTEPVRPLFRAAMRAADSVSWKLHVVVLAASRGFVAHPLDWMPDDGDSAPTVYAPWLDWQAAAAGRARPASERLSAENWEEFFPAARRNAVAEMRRSEPAAALALLASKAAAEPAETRLALVEQLRIGLSLADAPYLESLASDRSLKVRQLAARLLARIGVSVPGAAAEAAELAGLIEQSRAGLIRRRTVFAPAKLKSSTQQDRRGELFEICGASALAAQFGVSEAEFLAGWQLGVDEHADRQLARMVESSGSDAAVAQLAERLVSAGMAGPLVLLLRRLDVAAQLGAVKLVLSDGALFLRWLSGGSEAVAGRLDAGEIMQSRAYKDVRAAIAGGAEGGQWTARLQLPVFGFLADAAAARAIIDDMTAAGLAAADPALALLRLNAALDTSPTARS